MKISKLTTTTGARGRRPTRFARRAGWLLVGGWLVTCGLAAGAAEPGDWSGSWTGTAEMGATKHRLVFKISRSADGLWTAKVDSPDTGALNLAVGNLMIKNDTLHLEVRALGGIYDGTATPDMSRMAGRWQEGRQSMPLRMEHTQGTNGAANGLEMLSPADLEANKEAAVPLAGTWNGNLPSKPTDIGLTLKFVKTAAGATTGTLDSPDQRGRGLALSAITLKGGTVHFEAYGMGASFQGMLDVDGTTMTGQWRQAGQSLPVDFKKVPPVKPPVPGARP